MVRDIDANAGVRPHPVLRYFGHGWAVTERGVESLATAHPYIIPSERLTDLDWRRHLRGRDWVEEERLGLAIAFCQLLERDRDAFLRAYDPRAR